MKYTILFLSLLISSISFSQTLCDEGFAGDYPCNSLNLMSHLPLSTFGTNWGNDSWGWTDPETGKEYALFCNGDNISFIDISDPINPLYLGKLNTQTNWSVWRDVKVYNNYAFIVSEAVGHGMQIFDLTRLRDVANPPVVFTEDAHDSSFGGTHNIALNEETGYVYIIGSNQYDGGPIFINVQDPLNPINEGGYSEDGYTHDAQIVVYNGPDTDYTGKEIYFGANESSVVIVDVTDKNNPVRISELFYSNTAYTHQVWVDEEHTYLYCNDEIDEDNFGNNTRSIVFDLTDLDNPVLKMEYFGPTGAIDHNNYVVGDKLYLANYTAGLRVIDISDVENENMVEVASFDTHPANDEVSYNGAWSVYPFFESGNIVISDINEGLFIVSEGTGIVSNENIENGSISVFPNPASNKLVVNSNKLITKVEVYNMLGQNVLLINELSHPNRLSLDISNLTEGFYVVKVNGLATKKFFKE